MVDVPAMQQQTNLNLQDQIRRANDAQMEKKHWQCMILQT